MVGTYASAITIVVAAVVLGRGVCVLCGLNRSVWLSPAVGFAALMVLCDVAIALPGRGWTAVIAVVVACAASIWLVIHRRAGWPPVAETAVVGAVVLVFLSIPFLANARVGVLGISLLNDSHWHLLLAEGLRRPAIKAIDYGVGYPLGPHAVAAVFAQGLGSDVDKTLTGILMATPILTGLTALGFLGDLSRSRRLLVAILTAIPYMAAAWYIQSAFKEPIMALLLLGLVLVLQQSRRDQFARPVAIAAVIGVLVAGMIYVYSYPGLAWPVAIVVCWLALEFVFGGAWRHAGTIARRLRAAAPAIGIGLLVLIVLIAPDIGRIHDFWVSNHGTGAATSGGAASEPLANLVAPLRTLEGLNIWLSSDFRFVPADPLKAGLIAGFALVVLAFAVVSAFERREFPWLGALLAFGLAYAYTKHTSTAYVAAKALVIPAPFIVLGSGAALMRRMQMVAWRSIRTVAFAGAAILFFVLSFDSSYLVLRDAPVGPDNHWNELRSLRPLLHGRPTLVLFYDDYFQWSLLGEPVSSPLLASAIPSAIQPAKAWSYGQTLYFDSVDAATLNRFDYVITTRSDAGSPPPPNFHLVRSSRSYQVWHRVGPTRPFSVLPSPGAPGAILDCKTPAGRRISHEQGSAVVQAPPRNITLVNLTPGRVEPVTLRLPPGQWDLSLGYVSGQAITITGGGLDVRLPPNLDRPGSLWTVGRVTSTGAPILLIVSMSDPDLIPSTQYFLPSRLVAVRAGGPMTIPLRRACGRYVDTYEPS